MEKALWDKIEAIVDEALTMSGEERNTYITEQCKSDDVLLGHVTQLLNEIKEAEDSLFLEGKSEEFRKIATSSTIRQSEYAKGDEIGPYEIEGIIASGGMGSVYKAKRADGSFEMDVAIKVIKTLNYSDDTLLRFDLERQILAKLRHPNIARMLDGGITDDGFPYIILEFVNGIPIDEYCRKHNCSIKERIALFEQVLEGVRHAHENLVIHRDLKPGNILVNETGRVKVLDFGISKLLGKENDNSITQTGARLLTPRYAAPEQIRQENITTATDLYALGMVFYELLAGTSPFDLENASRYEIEQAAISNQPVKPSQKVKHPSEKKILGGDLDAIALKAIRKEPEQRYRVANEFLEDISDYQNGLPVSASEGTLKYRTQKFLGRHKQGATVALGILLLIVGFAGFYTWQITEERDVAQFQAQRAELVKEFTLSIFNSTNPKLVQHSVSDLKATQLLQYGIDRVENDFRDQPEIYIEMMLVIGDALGSLDDFSNAELALSKALDKSENYYGNKSMQTATVYHALAKSRIDERRIESAKTYINNAIAITENSRGGNDYKLAHYHSTLATSNAHEGKFRAAYQIYLKADSLYISSGNKEDIHRFTNLKNLAEVEIRLNIYESAEKHLKQSLSFYQSHYQGPHINVASTLTVLGDLKSRTGKYEEANEYLLKSLEIKKELLGEDNSSIALVYQKLSLNYRNVRDIENAFLYAQKNIETTERLYGKESIPYSQSLNNLAVIQLTDDNKSEAAYQNYEQALRIKEKLLEPDDPSLAISYFNFGDILSKMGKHQKAAGYLRKTLEIDKVVYGMNSLDIALDNTKLASILTYLGNYEEADSLFTVGRRIYLEKLPDNHERIAENLVEHGKLYHLRQLHKAAVSKLSEALKIYTEIFDKEDPRIRETQKILADAKAKR